MLHGKSITLKVLIKSMGIKHYLPEQYNSNSNKKYMFFLEYSAMFSFSHILILPAFFLLFFLQIPKNKIICFGLKLGKRHYISRKKFQSINWMPVDKMEYHCINNKLALCAFNTKNFINYVFCFLIFENTSYSKVM